MSEAQTRRSGRRQRLSERSVRVVDTMPALEINIPYYEILSEDELEHIHDVSVGLLEQIGIEFRDDEALALWREAGADVREQRVRIDRTLLMELVAKAPEVFTLHGRNPARSVPVGGRNMIFIPTYGSPYVVDLENTRRYSTLEDLQNLHKLAYQAPSLQVTGGITCEPIDVPVSRRHLHTMYSLLRHSDKPFMGATTARDRAEDCVEMARIVFGRDYLDDHTVMISVLNCNSPLVWDATMLDALKVYARNNQAVICAPFVMAGASTPASTAGSVAQLNAEALAGVAFGQVVKPGAPMVYGNFLATVSMRSGAPMAGTPEISQMNFMIGQLARRYRLPWRSSGMTAGSKVFDAQAAYESTMTMVAVLLSGANYVFHAAGWNEGGLSASFSKFMVDAEQIEMYHKLGRRVCLDDLEESLAELNEVGPGGHFLGTDHTRRNFQSAFFMPQLLDNNNYEQWVVNGSEDTNTRGLRAAREALEHYQEPGIDPAIEEELRAFITQREAVLPSKVS